MNYESSESVEELRRKLKEQLEQTGMNTVIKKLVEDACATKDNLLLTSPEEILQTIYNHGLMKTVIKQLDNLGRSEDLRVKLSSSWPEESDTDEEETTSSEGRRYYLKVVIEKGKAFLEHLSHADTSSSNQNICRTQKLVLYAFYKSQRFRTKSVDCQCDPHFKDEFVIDIGYFENGSVAKLLTIKEPLRIVIIREDVNLNAAGGGIVISKTWHDWRSVLLSESGVESISLELMGTGRENNVPVGLLRLKLALLPSPDEKVSESTFLTQLHSEKNLTEESIRFYNTFGKQWQRDFLNIRPTHMFRNVKIFAFDEKITSRPVMSFVQPLNVDRVFSTPFQAAWFVSLFSIKDTISTEPDYWQELDTTLVSKQGKLEDLCNLLCSLLLGFGLNAFVALGLEKAKVNSNTFAGVTVVTLDNSNKPTFWDSTTAKRCEPVSKCNAESFHIQQTIKMEKKGTHRLHTVGCLFNHESIFANIQPSDSVPLIDWNISNPTKWKSVPSKMKNKLQSPKIGLSILPSKLDCDVISAKLEIEIQRLIEDARKRQGLSMRWDTAISKLMGQQLATHELQVSTGGLHFCNFFETVIMKLMPSGYDFKGFHHRSRSTDAKNLFYTSTRELQCQEILYCRGDDAQLSLRVSVFPYPENVTSTRIMVGCKFIAAE